MFPVQPSDAKEIDLQFSLKDWVVVLLSALLFADTKLTLINIFGYAIGINLFFFVIPIESMIPFRCLIPFQQRER